MLTVTPSPMGGSSSILPAPFRRSADSSPSHSHSHSHSQISRNSSRKSNNSVNCRIEGRYPTQRNATVSHQDQTGHKSITSAITPSHFHDWNRVQCGAEFFMSLVTSVVTVNFMPWVKLGWIHWRTSSVLIFPNGANHGKQIALIDGSALFRLGFRDNSE